MTGVQPIVIQIGLQGDAATAAGAERVATSLGKIGQAGQTSARQTAAAMRQLPAQFTDIATQLAGGQNPLLVLLQQGGQIKDSFGGIRPAIAALTAAISPAALAVGAAAGAVAAFGAAALQGERESRALEQALALTGNAAGTTADAMSDMADRIGGRVGTRGSAVEALTALAETGRVGAGSLERFAEVAVRMERITGKAVGETAKVFADLARDPLQASVRLNESVGFLTRSLVDQIAALEKQGKQTDAARVAQQAYADVIDGRLTGLAQNLGTLETLWRNIKDGAAKAWEAMLGVGRELTPGQRISQISEQIAGDPLMAKFFGPVLRDEQAALQELERLKARGATLQAGTRADVQAYAREVAQQARQRPRSGGAGSSRIDPAVDFGVLDARDGRVRDLLRQDAANSSVDAFFGDVLRAADERDAVTAQRMAELRGKLEFEMRQAADRGSDQLSESLAEGILLGFRNGGRFADVFLRELQAQFAKTVLAPILRPTVEAGNSLIADILGGIVGAISGGGITVDTSGQGAPAPPVEGRPRGGMATGTNYVPRDMLALVHRGEAIVPAKYNPSAGGSGRITYAPQITIDSRTDQAQVAQLVAQANADGQRQMLELLRARGVL
jgi:hypothetical protein